MKNNIYHCYFVSFTEKMVDDGDLVGEEDKKKLEENRISNSSAMEVETEAKERKAI